MAIPIIYPRSKISTLNFSKQTNGNFLKFSRGLSSLYMLYYTPCLLFFDSKINIYFFICILFQFKSFENVNNYKFYFVLGYSNKQKHLNN